MAELRALWPATGELTREGRVEEGEERGAGGATVGRRKGGRCTMEGLLWELGPLLMRGCSSVCQVLFVTAARGRKEREERKRKGKKKNGKIAKPGNFRGEK
jgi:hypothetical protein